MIIVENMSQNTDEWLSWRKSKIGASDAPIIMKKSPWKTPQQLYQEKIGEISSNYENNAMIRGKALEPYALEEISNILKIDLKPEICIHEKYDYIIASLDGLSEDQKTAVEIKCPGVKTHIMAMEGKIPDHYQIQMQHQMAVTNLDQIIYYSYDGQEGIALECKRDQSIIDEMLEMEKAFYECIKNKSMPVDERIRTDQTWKEWANIWKKLQAEKKELERREKECKEALISLSDGCSYGEGVRVTEIEKKGMVDYSKIPVLKAIDLEKYRKPCSKYWRIQLT